MIDEATVIAAMAAVEIETRQRATNIAKGYETHKRRKAQSRVAQAKADAAAEIAELLEAMPMKSH